MATVTSFTYSLEGRDASAFTVQSNSGQLRTRSGVTYDYETKDTYSVTVRVHRMAKAEVQPLAVDHHPHR